MPVVIKGVTPTEMYKLLGIDQIIVDLIALKGISVFVKADGILVQSSDGQASGKIDAGLATMMALKKGTLAQSVKSQLKTKFEAAVKSVASHQTMANAELPVAKAADPFPASAAALAALGGSSSAMSALKPQAKASTPPGKIAPIWQVFDKHLMATAPLVKLRDATKLYQPVHGSSSGSRYFVVAAQDSIKVAARMHGGTLSIRIEGPSWKTLSSRISEVGFSVEPSKDYCSLHLQTGSSVMAAKCLGAILVGLGVVFDTPMPLIQVIEGQGS